ncbi:CGNR zinc finger domain-containing protein [Lentzea sp. NPDC005914]|uniref:CGNR zinc finger domain-containing protein n=1 Tax=Lentzea sp. NPDC005914 TaxID=3154572 RepID=UPI003405F56D
MTGLTVGWDHDVELLLDFLNTRHVLDSEASWRAWVTERGLGRSGEIAQARAARAALRSSIEGSSGPQTAAGVVHIELTDGVPVLSSSDALGAVLAASARLAVLGSWERFKICPADDCLRAFFDRSRNRSRTWCSMQVCGNREKARTFRKRTRAQNSDQNNALATV